MSTCHAQTAPNRAALTAGMVLWLLFCSAGLAMLARHSATAGETATIRDHWPAQSRLPSPAEIPTLLLFLHPQCPCSSATLGEIERATAGFENRCRVVVAVYTPESSPDGWVETALYRRAAALPHSTMVADVEGREAALFGATTSGHAMLFSADGERLFEGGVTAGRAHEGDNDGCTSLRSFLKGSGVGVRSTPVYGCPIRRPPVWREAGECEVCNEIGGAQ